VVGRELCGVDNPEKKIIGNLFFSIEQETASPRANESLEFVGIH
jgi:hypothetical protein